MGRLDDRTAIVTGGAQGIGATHAEALAWEGARVVVVDIADPSPAATRIQDSGGNAIGLRADISDQGAMDDVVRQTIVVDGGDAMY